MATVSNSPWRREATHIIRATLAMLPEGATLKQKRAALRAAYPWGAREHHPYRMWCRVVQEELGLARLSRGSTADFRPLPTPTPTGNSPLDRLLLALAAQPDDPVLLLAVADLLEEQGDERAATVRAIQPDAGAVARRLWPGCKVVGVRYRHLPENDIRPLAEVHIKGRRVAFLSRLQSEIDGQFLLLDPDITRAAQIERAALALALLTPAPI